MDPFLSRAEYIPEIDRYRREVRRLADERTGEPILNSSPDHAEIVIQQIFHSANERVNILSGSLTPRVYGRDLIVWEAALFLASSHLNRVQIILEQDCIEDRRLNPLLREVSKFKNVELRFASEEVRKLYDFHYIVTDNDCYRFEPDREYAVAVAAFGHSSGGQHLRGLHKDLWERCADHGLHL